MTSAAPDYGGLTGYEPISEADRKEFLDQGFLLVRNVLKGDHRAQLEAAMDRVYAEEQAAGQQHEEGRHAAPAGLPPPRRTVRAPADPADPLPVHVGPGRLEHLHAPQPPRRDPAGAATPEAPSWGWHQDGYRQNSDPETMDPNLPRPMFSLKIAYVISDLSGDGPRRHQGHPGQPPLELAGPTGGHQRCRTPTRRAPWRSPPTRVTASSSTGASGTPARRTTPT